LVERLEFVSQRLFEDSVSLRHHAQSRLLNQLLGFWRFDLIRREFFESAGIGGVGFCRLISEVFLPALGLFDSTEVAGLFFQFLSFLVYFSAQLLEWLRFLLLGKGLVGSDFGGAHDWVFDG